MIHLHLHAAECNGDLAEVGHAKLVDKDKGVACLQHVPWHVVVLLYIGASLLDGPEATMQ
jgi:hypothetical protein